MARSRSRRKSEARQALRQTSELGDELHKEQRVCAVSEVQEKYEANKRMLELAQLQQRGAQRDAEIARQKRDQAITGALAMVAVAIAALVSVLLARLRRAHRQLRLTSSCDPLTSLYNCRYFEDLLASI